MKSSQIFLLVSILSILLAVCITKAENINIQKSHENCFKQIDSLLKNDDNINIIVKSGQTYFGTIKKIAGDSIILRYRPNPSYNTYVRQTFKTDILSELNMKGVRTKYYFLPKSYSMFLFTATGTFLGFKRSRNSRNNSFDTLSVLVGTGIGYLFAKTFNQITSKTIDVDISI